jgi:hypothetical protein
MAGNDSIEILVTLNRTPNKAFQYQCQCAKVDLSASAGTKVKQDLLFIEGVQAGC